MKRPALNSIATRLTLLYTFSAFSLIVLATGFLFMALIQHLDQEDKQFLADKVHVIRTILMQRPHDPEALQEEVKWEGAVRRFTKFYVRVMDAQGHTLLESSDMNMLLPPTRFPPPLAAAMKPGPGVLLHGTNGLRFRAIAVWAPLGVDGRQGSRIIQIATDQSDEEALLANYRHTMMWVLFLGLLLSAGLGYVVARKGMEPLTDMARDIQEIRATRLDRRITGTRWPDELESLADTFNEMLDRLQESFDRLARFSADLAHELRTPLNNLRGEAEVALSRGRTAEEYRQVIESSLEEYARLSRMIDSLLFLARAESAEDILNLSTFELSPELERICAFFEATAEEQGVALHCAGAARLHADRLLLQRAVGNLLSNALHHTSPGGRVDLHIQTSAAATEIEIADNGCGIAPDHLPHVFDRFYRADPARARNTEGMGLGLALVRSIMDLHRGSVEIHSQPGRGTQVLLRFPSSTIPPQK